MTPPRIVDPATVLGEPLTDESPDLMRHLLETMINALLSADADAVVGAEWGERSESFTSHRNGYRHRNLALPLGVSSGGTPTRTGKIDASVPKLRERTYFPE